jgi:peptidoglycan hydrolase FlgJ
VTPTSAANVCSICAIGYHLFTGIKDIQENPTQKETQMQTPLIGANFKPPVPKPDSPLMQKAKELEASFLSEMLGHAGLGASEGSFSGGIGEEQFASFLRDAQAKQMVAHGGIGLAEQLFHAMSKGQNNAD